MIDSNIGLWVLVKPDTPMVNTGGLSPFTRAQLGKRHGGVYDLLHNGEVVGTVKVGEIQYGGLPYYELLSDGQPVFNTQSFSRLRLTLEQNGIDVVNVEYEHGRIVFLTDTELKVIIG